MKKFQWIAAGCLLGLFFTGLFSCQKKTQAVYNPATPLQNLINTDTTLSLFHHLVLRGNDAALLVDDSATLLIPPNPVLRAAGLGEATVDSVSSSYADRMLRYQYLPSGLSADAQADVANPTRLGPALYALLLPNGTIQLNRTAIVSGSPKQVGKARVYLLNSLLTPGADSLPVILQNDSSLTFLARAFSRTNFYDSAMLTGSYTLLAPVNDAFRRAGYDSLGAIDSADITALVQLVGNQVIKGRYFSSSFPSSIQRVVGGDVTVHYVNGLPEFSPGGNPGPVKLLNTNQVTGNNLILHWTDGILSP
ncbi:MAG TPA: fasciclin domain-containing protein [Puia sp.]